MTIFIFLKITKNTLCKEGKKIIAICTFTKSNFDEFKKDPIRGF